MTFGGHICGSGVGMPLDLPDVGDGFCCLDRIEHGPEACTCWDPEYDMEQVEPVTTWGPPVRHEPCGDCAYRPDSPERQGEEHVTGSAELLDELVLGDTPFFCHDGIRRPVLWRHPCGATVPGSDVNYRPPIIEGTPYRANGQPAFICAGWAARRDRFLSELGEAE